MSVFAPGPNGTILVDLPEPLLAFVANMAYQVRQTVADSSAPGYERICSPVDPSLDDDDPLARLERQYSIESIASGVLESLDSPALTEEQAEAWLSVMTMANALRAHLFGVFTDDDRAALGPEESLLLDVSPSLQFMLVEALDAC